MEIKIDNETYKVKDDNCYKTPIAKTQIILATSLRKNDYHIKRLLHKDFGKSKRWNTYTISREGIIYQHYDDIYHSDFLNIKNVDKQTISIVLENMCSLFESPNGDYINWLNEICDKNNIIEKKWLGYKFWEKFPNKQIESTALLCQHICEKHNIPKVCVEFNHYHKDISKFRGIAFKGNYVEDSNDVNPMFNIQKFNKLLKNEIN